MPDAVATPYSYNTPLGIARFVNSTNFDGAKYVIFEMGARKPGDIFKLCNLVKPNVGVLTGICEQHLESFGSLDAVVKTKCELLRYLGPNDLCVINAFDQVASNCFGVGVCKKKLSSSVWERFCLVSTCLEGTVFVCNQDNCQTTFCSPLFGVAHFENVVLCVSVALSLGLNVEDIASKVSTLTPIEHRLQVLDGGQVTVVDDAYNANLEGVKKTCQSFLYLNCKKIVISQGVVEGGSRQAYINNKVGQLLGEAFDVVVACGPNAKDIVAGVGNLAQVYLANSLNDAVGIAQTCYENGAVCLFQNDIPKLF